MVVRPDSFKFSSPFWRDALPVRVYTTCRVNDVGADMKDANVQTPLSRAAGLESEREAAVELLFM